MLGIAYANREDTAGRLGQSGVVLTDVAFADLGLSWFRWLSPSVGVGAAGIEVAFSVERTCIALETNRVRERKTLGNDLLDFVPCQKSLLARYAMLPIIDAPRPRSHISHVATLIVDCDSWKLM